MKFWQYRAFSEPEQLVEIARHCEEAGFDGVLLGDPLFLPENLASRHPCSPGGTPGFDGGAPWPDPWVAIGAMGAVTEKLLARREAERILGQRELRGFEPRAPPRVNRRFASPRSC